MNEFVRTKFRATLRATTLAGLLLAAANPLSGQEISTYPTVRHAERFEIDWTGFYREGNRRTAEARARFAHVVDLAYGQDPKQRLDLYLPAGVDDAPVLLFLHGGGFGEGDRAHYGFVAEVLAANGVITAVASYRLGSAGHLFPAPRDDARAALAWLHDNIATHGGDRERLYVGGHSAGGLLAADLGADTAWLDDHGISRHVLRGIVPVSGPYDLRGDDRPGYIDSYAPDTDSRVAASPLARLIRPAPYAVIATGEQEPSLHATAESLDHALRDAGTCTRRLVLESADHADTALAFADPGGMLTAAILEMIMGEQMCVQPSPPRESVVFFYYEDLDAARTFYAQRLGLEPTLEMEWVTIYRIGPGSSVGVVQDGHGYHAVSEDRPAMLSIVIDDVDGWYAHLRAADVPVLSSPPSREEVAARGDEAPPIRGFLVEDPGGYTIEFFSWRDR